MKPGGMTRAFRSEKNRSKMIASAMTLHASSAHMT